MKKLVIVLTAGVLTAGAAQAQTFRIGPEAGLMLTNISTKVNDREETNDPRLGLRLGLVGDLRLNSVVSLQSGIYFARKGSTRNYSESIAIGGLNYNADAKYDTRISYLELPVNLQLNFGDKDGFSFFVGGGPYVAMGLGGRMKYDYKVDVSAGSLSGDYDKSEEYDLKIGNDKDEHHIKQFDAGLGLNAGIRFPFGMFLRAQGSMGLANIFPGGDENFRGRNWTAGLTLGVLVGD